MTEMALVLGVEIDFSVGMIRETGNNRKEIGMISNKNSKTNV